MLKLIVRGQNALHNLRNNERGVVSFEYVIVAACIVASVAFAFGTGAGGKITTALQDAIDGIVAFLPKAPAPAA